MKLQQNIDRCDRSESVRTRELQQAAEKMATFQRISWKEAFGRVASPAVRVHRFRNAHSRLLREALGDLDCPDPGSRKR